MNQSVSAHSHHVTAVISHRVKPGREKGYEEWLKGIAAAAREFEGHLGVSILRPQDGRNPNYVSILKFDHVDHLQGWLKSEIRHEWIERAQPLIREPEDVQILTGLEAWFQLPQQPVHTPPKRYKVTLVTWLGVYALSLIVGHFIAPLIAPLPLLVRQAISTGLIVLSLAYAIMPQLTRLFYKWLYPTSQA